MTQHILMVAAENDALPGTKVGGVGDVLRDLPKALKRKGCELTCILPSYGFLARLPATEHVADVRAEFMGQERVLQLLKIKQAANQADIYILHHELFSRWGETVYCHDGKDRPFASDATKFAFFCRAIAEAMLQGALARPDVLHCHDWHSAFLLILLEFDPRYSDLKNIRTVYSVHNLALQGIRPFRGDDSSFENWYPNLRIEPGKITDPIVPHCLNPMRAGILLADKVNTVSPSYSAEILEKSDHANGIYGGENLDLDLRYRAEQGDLVGILNGCEYPRTKKIERNRSSMAKLMLSAVQVLAAKQDTLRTVHWLATQRLQTWMAKKKADLTITSVGRITEQKVRLLFVELEKGQCALELMLKALGKHGHFIMLGSGDKAYEQKLCELSAANDNFIFINGYAADVGDLLYEQGDLFLMPSSFEPCGISQMLAMRNGQPCFVHSVGGLKDTVESGKNGFAFEGEDLIQQAKAMVQTFAEVINVKLYSPEIWEGIQKRAAKSRFTWDKSADQYIERLYS